MREQLLGYLLGALEPDEQEAVQNRLAVDPELRRDLELMRRGLEPLADDAVCCPSGLAARCCEYVARQRGPAGGQFASRSDWRLVDLAMAAGLFLAASLLLFPALHRSRVAAQAAGCRQNLMTLGEALGRFSAIHEGFFPTVPTEGNLAVAGMYAPTLRNGGYITSAAVVCPASDLARDVEFEIPTLADVERALGQELRRLQHRMGGSYGYGLGYTRRGEYVGRRNQGRETFALVSDAPPEAGMPPTMIHGCGGLNVLFEDGHVRSMSTCHLSDCDDHIFQNGLGMVAAGIDVDDAVLVSSGVPVKIVKALLTD